MPCWPALHGRVAIPSCILAVSLPLQRALAPGQLEMNRSELIATLADAWGAEPWVSCDAS